MMVGPRPECQHPELSVVLVSFIRSAYLAVGCKQPALRVLSGQLYVTPNSLQGLEPAGRPLDGHILTTGSIETNNIRSGFVKTTELQGRRAKTQTCVLQTSGVPQEVQLPSTKAPLTEEHDRTRILFSSAESFFFFEIRKQVQLPRLAVSSHISAASLQRKSS